MTTGSISIHDRELIIGPHPNVINPIIDGTNATDIPGAEGAADPFIVFLNNKYFMFVEVFGDDGTYISYYESDDGIDWHYGKKLLGDGIDLFSYPLVFQHDSDWYMTPTILYEGKRGDEDFPLYRASSFPNKWELVQNGRITSHAAMDASPFKWNENWYVIAQDREEDGRYGNCRMYFADDLESSNWAEHPESPIVSGPHSMVRGFPMTYNEQGYVDLFIGWEHVDQYRINNLTPSSIDIAKLNKVVRRTGRGWNSLKMHHLDARLLKEGHNLVVADGARWGGRYSVGLYSAIGREEIVWRYLSKQFYKRLILKYVAPAIYPILKKIGIGETIKSSFDSFFEE